MARRTMATVESELEAARRNAERLQLELSASRNTTTAVNDELENFKRKVREVALTVKEDNSWCDDGFNAVMNELGLDPLPHTFKVKMLVTATREVEIEVDANDLDPESRTLDGASEYVADIDAARDYISSELGYGDWDLTETEILEVEAITD